MPNEHLDNLVQEVSETSTVQASAVALLAGLKQRLDTAIAELAQQSIDNATLNQLSADLDASTNALAEAVAANTVAEEETPPEETTEETPPGQ